MDRLEETGVGDAIHTTVLGYEVALLQEHIETHPEMSTFSKMVNMAVMQYFMDRIEIINGGTDDKER